MNEARRKEAWRKAHEAALQIYRMTACGPEDEGYELAGEMVHNAQALALSLSDDSDLEDAADVAAGKVARLECLVVLAGNLGFFGKEKLRRLQERLEEIGTLVDHLHSKP